MDRVGRRLGAVSRFAQQDVARADQWQEIFSHAAISRIHQAPSVARADAKCVRVGDVGHVSCFNAEAGHLSRAGSERSDPDVAKKTGFGEESVEPRAEL